MTTLSDIRAAAGRTGGLATQAKMDTPEFRKAHGGKSFYQWMRESGGGRPTREQASARAWEEQEARTGRRGRRGGKNTPTHTRRPVAGSFPSK